ncbi:MAG: aminomethyl-transferring glycine dehydrogenase subunit GcvPA [SAR202 cluster bacterium]|nr:aminomethyl-transferring glycine dehydrogenase subunit GcvPA [SAR202 cluster bacterium]|tara:strand:- start:9933 stop:11276 length:1344 start_codon:yes stop_codon:yes gene_type:complete
MTSETRHSPYVPNTDADRDQIIKCLGVSSTDELFGDIPKQHYLPNLKLNEPLSELEITKELQRLSMLNYTPDTMPCFLGGGAYRHFIPSIVKHVISRGEFATAYTPYQPEVSQGTLQTIYEFQSLVCQLFEMDIANSGMYDGATAIAEAALMACRITNKDRIAVLNTLSPVYVSVIRTYVEPQGLKIYSVDPSDIKLDQETACILVQHPNFYGYLEDLKNIAKVAHENDALLVTSTDPIFLGMFNAPGKYGADIAVAEGQPLGVPLSYGGPYVGLFTCKSDFVRQMPGRIVGKTTDTKQREGYVLTLQTREQHIRRERATSNICTSEALIGTAVVAYIGSMGRVGIKHVAEMTYHKAHYASSMISKIPGYSLPFGGTFFKEFVVRCPISPAKLNSYLLENGLIGGIDVSDRVENGLLIAVTEMNTKEEIDRLVYLMAEHPARGNNLL